MEKSPKRLWRRLRVEPLEERHLLAALTVNSASDVTLAGDGLVTLREAIAAANANTTTDLGHTGSGADTIVFDPAAFATPQTLALTQGELAITDAVSINGPGRHLLTIDAQMQSRIFHFGNQFRANFTISGLTLTRAIGGAIDDLTSFGGSTITLIDSTVSGNSGAGISAWSTNVTLSNCVVTDNAGNGIDNYYRNITAINSTISGNAEFGIQVWGKGYITLNSTTVCDNDAGGISIESDHGGGVSLNSSTVEGNGGAGISTLFYRGNIGDVTLASSTVSGDSSGGISAYGGRVTLANSTVSGNTSSGNGGGIWTNGSVRLDSSTVSGNTGGSYSLYGGVEIYNSIVTDGISSGNEGNISIAYSIVGIIDPLLGPLANNGGPTKTHALLAGSPAINGGDPTAIAGQGGTPLYDQRGAPFSRVHGGRMDMGAFELQPPACYGDFNQDRSIDAADYIVYRKFLGTSVASYSLADSDGDGSITPDDDDPWETSFGSILDTLSQGSNPVSGRPQLVIDDATVVGSMMATVIPAAIDQAIFELAPPDASPTALKHSTRMSRAEPTNNVRAAARILHLLDVPHIFDLSMEIESDLSSIQTEDPHTERDDLTAERDATSRNKPATFAHAG